MPRVCEITTDFIRLAREHAGRWVALDSETGEVVAVGESPEQVLEAALAAGASDAILTQVVNDYGAFVTCLA